MKWVCLCIVEFLTCIIGYEHNLKLLHCNCESICETMCRARIWPSTPTNPGIGFSFELLDWAEALLLECQVALQDFCSAVKFKCQRTTSLKDVSCILMLTE